MRLPDDSVGITDVMQYRECPQRFAFGMRRHTEAGEHPQALTPATAYGSAIHEAIDAAGRGADDAAAAQAAFNAYAGWLEPDDLARLERDLATYRQRDYTPVRTVGVELEIRVPLFEHDGRTIYFRGRIDRLYESLDRPGQFIHIDYKSSRHPRSEEEVHADPQLWAYNYLIHEYFPECRELVQIYEQLEFGSISTRKSPEQREQMRRWLIHQVTAILADEVLAPRLNDWCSWCPLLADCAVVRDLTPFALARISGLAPLRPGADEREVDPWLLESYVERLEEAEQASKALDAFIGNVKDVLRKLPEPRRRYYGYTTSVRKATVFSAEALQAAHTLLGDEFYEAVGLTRTRIKGHPREKEVMRLAEKRPGSITLRKVA